MKKKRIAFYGIKYFPSKGGTSRVIENLIYQLRGDFDITIYCYKNAQARNHIPGVRTVEIRRIPFGNFGTFLYYFLCYCHIRWRDEYDIIHAHKIDSFLFLPRLSRKAKVIATVHEAPYKSAKWGWFAIKYFKICEHRFLKFKGTKTSISRSLADYYEQEFGSQLIYIPNGINIDEPVTLESIEDYWPMDLPSNSSFVLFAARRIMSTKGLHTMLSAYKKLNYKGNILITGEEDHAPEYMKQIRQNFRGLRLYFLGFVHPLSSLLSLVQKCEYFVFPTETEAMSIMLLEVASMGKPIIASDISANTNIFDQTEILFFEDKNINDLAEKIQWAETNVLDFIKKGQNAKRKVETQYNWESIVLKYKSLYDAID